jgi:hypothetical protein
MSPLRLRACPKCGGTLQDDGQDFGCINCGYVAPRCAKCGSVAFVDQTGYSCGCGWSQPFPPLTEQPHLPGEELHDTTAGPLRVCAGCRKPRPRGAFGSRMGRHARALRSLCRDCDNAARRKRRARSS